MQLKHTDRPCDKCDAKFKTYNELRRHKAEVHGGKVHKCGTCGEKFKLKSAYDEHVVTHDEERTVIVCKRDGCGR